MTSKSKIANIDKLSDIIKKIQQYISYHNQYEAGWCRVKQIHWCQ